MKRLIACALAAALLGGAAPAKHHATAHKVGKHVLPIAVVINGTKLAVNPPPVMYRDHLLVPVRRILSVLGLTFEKDGRYVRTYAGAKTIQILIGSKIAQVDNQPVELDAAPMEIKNVLYAPLRFFAEALQAQAVFDRQTNSVEIVSTLVGRSGTGIVNNVNGQVQMMGTVTQVDLDSDPPSITIAHNATVRTLQVTPRVSVIVQDVNAGTSNAGDLSELHAGDYAHVYLDKQGQVKRIVDAFGSRSGTVAAIAAGQIVLGDGHVIVPSRTTTITLNGRDAGIGALAVGDELMVRYNIDSSEPLQIVATRASPGEAPAAQTGVSIASIAIAPHRPLAAGGTLSVTLRGTPGGTADFDIGPYVRGLSLAETQPGVYTGSYTVKRGENFADAPVFGYLHAGGADAPRGESGSTVSVSTEPPGIVDFAPDEGAAVNNARPNIYATFASGTVPVNASSARIEVNGHDVTSSSIRTERFIEYTPGIDYPAGPMRVTVQVKDAAGNAASKSWTFFIRGGRS